jgi:hypothetical protein
VVVGGDEIGGVVDRLQLEQLEQRFPEGDPALVVEVVKQAVGGEHAQARIFERDEAGEGETGIVVGAGADLVGVGAGGLVAVVSVGDQQLRAVERRGDPGVNRGIGDRPGTVDGPVGVGDLAERRFGEGDREVAPGVAGMEHEDRGEVVLGGPGQTEAVLLRTGLGPLVGADQPRPVGGHGDSGDEPAPGLPGAIRRGVVLLQRPDRRLGVLDEPPRITPMAEQIGGVRVDVGAVSGAGQVELDDVVARARQQLRAAGIVDHVVRRSGDVSHLDRRGVVVQGPECSDVGHRLPA